MSDLVSGRYPNANPMWSLLGQQNNVAQPDVPLYTNYFPLAAIEAAESLVTAETVFTPIFVPAGVELKKASFIIGATTETVSHFVVSLYEGLSPETIGGEIKPKLLAKSKDETGYKGKTETVSVELEKSVLVTEGPKGNAPHGFLYCGITITATKVGGYITLKLPSTLTKGSSTNKVFPWFAGAPILPGFKTAEKEKAAEEVGAITNVETVPLVCWQ